MQISNYFLRTIVIICLFCSFGFVRAMKKFYQKVDKIFYKNFLDACRNGDIKRVQEFLDEGVDPNYAINSWPPIFEAVLGNQLNVLKLLIKKGADINYKIIIDEDVKGEGEMNSLWLGLTIFHLAVLRDRKEIVNWLLEIEADITNIGENIFCTIVSMLLEKNRFDLVKWLIDEKGYEAYPGLWIIFLEQKHSEAIRWLAEEKFDLREYHNKNSILIHLLLSPKKYDQMFFFDMLEFFLSCGIDINHGADVLLCQFIGALVDKNTKREAFKKNLPHFIKKIVTHGFNINKEIIYNKEQKLPINMPHGQLLDIIIFFENGGMDLQCEELKIVLQKLRCNQESLKKHINDLTTMMSHFNKNGILDQEEKDTILKEIKKIFDTNETPMYAKQTTVVDLYKLHHAYRNYQVKPIPFEDVLYCTKKILFNTRFFCDSAFTLLREFVTTNKIKDILGRSILEEAIVFCPCEYKNKRITKILCTDESLCKNRKLFRQCLVEQPRDDFMNALALAKEMKRKEDFRMLANFAWVKNALQNGDFVDDSGNRVDYSQLPPEVGMHILSFAGVQSFTDKMIFGKKYSKKTVN